MKQIQNQPQPRPKITKSDTLTNEPIAQGHEYDGHRELDKCSTLLVQLFVYGYDSLCYIVLVFLVSVQAQRAVQEKEFAKAMAAAEREQKRLPNKWLQPRRSNSRSPKAFEIALLTDEPSLNSGKRSCQPLRCLSTLLMAVACSA
jgi:hypothetical protein